MVQLAARAGSPQLVALGFRTYPNFCWEIIFSRDRDLDGRNAADGPARAEREPKISM